MIIKSGGCNKSHLLVCLARTCLSLPLALCCLMPFLPNNLTVTAGLSVGHNKCASVKCRHTDPLTCTETQSLRGKTSCIYKGKSLLLTLLLRCDQTLQHTPEYQGHSDGISSYVAARYGFGVLRHAEGGFRYLRHSHQ